MSFVVGASRCLAIARIVLGGAALAVFGKPMPALRVTVELLIAAGLLRLSVDSSWTAILVAAALIALRRTITRSLTADFTASAWGHRTT